MAIQLRQPRVGLVLGAGGVLGGAWTAGALTAIASETGWDPSTATHIVGTSAGSLFSALTAAGVGPERLMPVAADALDAEAADWILSELSAEAAYRPSRVPTLLPGSIGLAVRGIRERSGSFVLKALSGLGPKGIVSTEPIERTVRRAVGEGAQWVRHPACWIVACDYQTGERVVFGRPGAPPAPIAAAVAASCSIPSFFEPVRIGDRHFVDGGLHSMSNADLLADQGLDLCVILNPLSSRSAARSWHPLDQVTASMRRLAVWQLEREVTSLLDQGTHVVVLEPTREDAAAIGPNMMDARRSVDVAETSLCTTREQIRRDDVAELLSLLPRRRGAAQRAGQFRRFLRRPLADAAAAV